MATPRPTVSAIDDGRLRERGFDPVRLGRVRERILADIDAGNCHGVSMMVARHGDVVLNLTEGFADKAAGKALTPDALFATMSVAKQFTNVLALSLVERGLLSLHAPVAELIPEFATLGKEKVNLFHLLTHTSGVMSAVPPVPPEVLMNIDKLVEFACGLPLESQPGERVNYSILLGHSIIAALCLRADGRGRRYADMLREDLFEPLGMHDTSLGPRDDLVDRLCPVKVSYTDIPALLPPEAVEGIGAVIAAPGAELPGGGCMTSIGDVHRFAEMLRRGGELDGARILSPGMIDFCTKNQTGEMRNVLFDMWMGTRNWLAYPANIGCGFFLRGEGNLPGLFSVMNSPRTFGGFGAGSTGFTVDPERDLSLAFLSTGLMEDSYHFERIGAMATLVLAAMTD
ncbi:MAG: serine hydrolase domain-containing protein [Gammaproteobacteria bacterium]